MDKISFIQVYIDKCDTITSSNDWCDAGKTEDEIIGVFSNEIKNITNRLTGYHYNGDSNHIENIKILKQKLLNHAANIKEERSKREHELELARLKQPNISAHAEASPTQNQNASVAVSVAVSLEQSLKLIEDISENKLSSSDKESLRELLYSLEGVKATKDKSKFWSKSKDILKFVADKGADAAIAALPLIISGL